jgi:cytoskeleton protein RodZ
VLPKSANTVPWVFTASAESWLELRDAQNSVVWSGVLKAGETMRIESPLPVRVVVGRAQAVSVTLRGAAFDLKPHTQVAVARFEVKE